MNTRQSQIIYRPIINEKTTMLTALGQYTFEVAKDANKIEIAQAVEQLIKDLYPKNKTEVLRVNTSAIRGRIRRNKQASKKAPRAPKDSKKAIVTLVGDPLDIFSA
jgi:large subunit ribosomal protein L23